MTSTDFTVRLRHGSARTYKAGCRCDACREGQRIAVKTERAKRKLDYSDALSVASDAVALASLARDIRPGVGRELGRIAKDLGAKSERMAGQ